MLNFSQQTSMANMLKENQTNTFEHGKLTFQRAKKGIGGRELGSPLKANEMEGPSEGIVLETTSAAHRVKDSAPDQAMLFGSRNPASIVYLHDLQQNTHNK